MAWAIEQQEIKDPEGRLVLICLANYADAVGHNAFPSNRRLCLDTGLCERAVRMWLRKLEQAIVIRRGNQAVAAAQIGRADRRPVVYDILIERGAPQTPREPNGGHLTTERGALEASTGGIAYAPDPKRSVREPKSVRRTFEEEFRSRFGYTPTEIPAQKGRGK